MNGRKALKSAVVAIILLGLLASYSLAANWPMYRCDAARQAISPDELKTPLYLQWTYVPRHKPQPAWPEPGRELHRMPFDYAYQVAVANRSVYFGSSADHKVYALDLATGRERWSFFTEGPVRFAPAIEGDRVFAASDDGWLYCLSAGDGSLLWRFHGGPRDERLMGNEQMISRWPLRSGVAVRDGLVYFACGMWPSEGVYVYALRADSGSIVWKNDTSGFMYIRQPHPPSQAMTGVAPQGYVVVSQGEVFIPTGRNVAAAYDRKTGKLLYYRGAPNTWGDRWGGAWNFAADGLLFGWRGHTGPDIDVRIRESEPWPGDGLIAFECQTGKVKRELPGKLRAVLSNGVLYASGSGKVTAYDFQGLLEGKKPEECTKWETPHGRAYTLILIRGAVVVGGNESVTAINANSGEVLWKSSVEGQARGLAVADGRLLVSTTTGRIICFGPQQLDKPTTISPSAAASAYPQDNRAVEAILAEQIIEKSGQSRGLCLVLGVGDGRFVYELAKRSQLRIYCIDADEDKVARARRSLDRAGLYGPRVVVHRGSPNELPYADYFANLIGLRANVDIKLDECSASELYRVLRPCGGVAYVALSGRGGVSSKQVERWLRRAKVPASEIHPFKGGIRVVRGELPGAGTWSHQYADAARSGASSDQIVRLPLKVLWFGKPGPAPMVSRHWRGPAPLSVQGRLFVIGQFTVIAVDAYNGYELWRRDFKQAARYPINKHGGNAAADADSVYVITGKTCLRLDAETGETVCEYQLPIAAAPTENPSETATWDNLAVADDLIIGTPLVKGEARQVFALNKDDGSVRWLYTAKEAVHHDAIVVGNNATYLIDRTSSAKLDQMKRRGERPVEEAALVALDLSTGEVLWKTDRGLAKRQELRLAQGTLLATGGGRMTVYSAESGKMLSWSGVAMRRFPVIVGDTIYGEPYAYDLLTGQRKMRTHPLTGQQVPWRFARSYGCGSIAGAPGLLLFRSGTLGFYDLAGDSGIHNFGGVRAGCYVNAIAANGLVLVPPGDAGCTCSYNYQTTVALMPARMKNEEWAVFTADNVPSNTAIRHLALNFGVPGDRRDTEGSLWLAFPRPPTPAAVKVPVSVELAENGEYYHRNANELRVEGTSNPWLYASGCRNLKTLTINLGTQEPKSYTVRLHFAELDDVDSGERVFDVKLQDKLVVERLDIVKAAGGPRKAFVKEFASVEAGDVLKLEFVPRSSEQPIISAIEIHEE